MTHNTVAALALLILGGACAAQGTDDSKRFLGVTIGATLPRLPKCPPLSAKPDERLCSTQTFKGGSVHRVRFPQAQTPTWVLGSGQIRTSTSGIVESLAADVASSPTKQHVIESISARFSQPTYQGPASAEWRRYGLLITLLCVRPEQCTVEAKSEAEADALAEQRRKQTAARPMSP